MELIFDEINSPLGPMLAVSRVGALCSLDWSEFADRQREQVVRRFGDVPWKRVPDPNGISRRLRGYFDGDIGALGDIAVDTGGTPFQGLVWQALRTIPPGLTVSYAELAQRIGRPGSARAVGHANSLNPVCLVLPCHRVVGSDARLVGYAGGLDRKRWLLNHEWTMRVKQAAPLAYER
jgi:methylated-DNA-[protein]-cysteine S-methyltransferase